MEQIRKQLEGAGFDYAIAIATEAEIGAGAACGQLSIIIEKYLDMRMGWDWSDKKTRDIDGK